MKSIKVIESKEGLAVAGEVLMSISKDERERAKFRNRRIALADRESDRVTAERRGEKAEREKWRGVVAEKDAALVDMDAKIADKDAKIAGLLARLGEL